MLWPAEMQEQQEGAQRRLGVLSPEADDRPTRAGRVIVNPLYLVHLPIAEMNLLPHEAPFRDAAVILYPIDVPLAAPVRPTLFCANAHFFRVCLLICVDRLLEHAYM